MSAARRSALASLAAMCIQGMWAAYANHTFGPWIAGRAAVVQGLCSFGMTYCVTRLIEWQVARFRSGPPALRIARTALFAIAWMLGVQVLAHWLAGTPHIAATIAPAASLGTVYCIVYSIGRVKLETRPATHPASPPTTDDAALSRAAAVTPLTDRKV